MGVPALFRWLSKKYPKIVEQVIEDTPQQIPVQDGFEEIPIDMSRPNPNGVEFDNLYLDMNGIVHPCTHPEGKKPPETEAEMMIEVFKYTDRVVNMVRPRKLLMIAIDGVAPRAKMNQQRSRRFRAAQESKIKEEETKLLIEEWRLKGKDISNETNTKPWDSNAITPGTPFMTLLTESLRYWIVHKLNTDKGWKGIQVILSDASVPGEGEHKIMDFIRRQRTQPTYDPNTSHVIYGLDADLIMLSLATHEPHFKVLREDVFADEKKRKGCYTCGQHGHHSSQCQGKPKEKLDEFDVKHKPLERKPFIFLNVETLREYLSVELRINVSTFSSDLERAIDDWVLLIFFVGNDFLPHLPSLEIREGAIDTLLKIWKSNLDRMGGYLTNDGKLNLKRTEIILEGLAAREDEIFLKRREAETKQDRESKRRRIDSQKSDHSNQPPPNSHVSVQSLPNQPSPSRVASPLSPTNHLNSSSIPGLGSSTQLSMMSNMDIVKNRFAIRTANLDAAAMLKAQLSGKLEVPTNTVLANQPAIQASNNPSAVTSQSGQLETASTKELVQPDVEHSSGVQTLPAPVDEPEVTSQNTDGQIKNQAYENDDSLENPSEPQDNQNQKRKASEIEGNVTNDLPLEEVILSENEDDEEPGNLSVLVPGQPCRPAPLKMLGNSMVEQDDTVKLWEPGYRERYFRQKFGLELSDEVERRKIVKCYLEGLAWVLAYYYQGCQSWHWFYPYHYSPFAADFINLEEFEIKFELGQPFKPYEQLMGVFPAASRSHIPAVFHELMTSDDSPIKDFYPEEFEIDMNGKKMLWQGIALLPFIEQDRLLSSMKQFEGQLKSEDKSRNEHGDAVMFCGENHPQYDSFCKMYRKRDTVEPITLDPSTANGVFGSALPDPSCIPGSTFHSPLHSVGLPDIANDNSLFARFFVPPQLVPHRSVLLNGVKLQKYLLNHHDREAVHRGGNYSAASGSRYGDGFHQQRRDMGDGPGTINPYSTNHHSGGRGGFSNSYRGSNFQQPYSQAVYGNVYGNQGASANQNGHNGYRGGVSAGPAGGPPGHRPAYGSQSSSHYGYGSQASHYTRPRPYGADRGGYQPPYPPPHQPMSRGRGYIPPPIPVGYGGTGVGLNPYQTPNQHASSASPYNTPASQSSSRGGYRPPHIIPATTRPIQNHQSVNHGSHHQGHPQYSQHSTSASYEQSKQ
ncbi:hypothetical protein O181_006573 [Austropuccinia psidii MF-1]|uniref:5'-3' exoribonuclease n=1 Tax=Austropuccinia psidii MF-1 TaxID=1389203 RepID=A0A9Q3BKQ9_9BASI|nr:hypothetical protein [Austropuccinia psidii MF-1]